jgi:hypothetical protein
VTEVDKLKANILIHGINRLHIFPGTNPNTSEEQVAAAINQAIEKIIDGDYEEIE